MSRVVRKETKHKYTVSVYIYPANGQRAVQLVQSVSEARWTLTVGHTVLLRNESPLAASAQAPWYTDTQLADSWDVQGDVTTLHIEAFFSLNNIVSTLLFEGIDPNARDSLRTTSLIYAASKGRVDVANTLLYAGASASDV